MARLGNYIRQVRGVSYKPGDLFDGPSPDAITVLRANNITDSGEITLDDVVWVAKERVKEQQLIKAGDILVCASSGSKNLVGKAAQAEKDLDVAFGAFCKVVRPMNANKKYIGYFFQSPIYRRSISYASAGVNINNIRSEDLDALAIDLPDADEQAMRVKKLEKLARSIALRKKQLDKIDLLIKSQFIEMFEKREFDVLFFGDLCEFLRNGANIKQSKGAGGYPITRIETLSNDVFNANRLGYADITDLDRYQGYLLHEGDILISHINSIAYLGRAVQYRGELDLPVIHGMNLLCARLKKSVLPDYIEAYFRTKKAKEYISTITKKAVNQASITITDLKKMKVPVPPIELQSEFAHFVEQTDKSKFRIKQSLEKLEKCYKALLQKYFG